MNKKSVLMISYFYPPLAGMGMVRSLKFAQYLPEYGWESLVLTPRDGGTDTFSCDVADGDLPGVKVIRTGNVDVPLRLKKIFGFKLETPISNQAKIFQDESVKSRFFEKSLEFTKNALLFPDSKNGWYRSAVRDGLAAIKIYKPDIIYSTSPPVTAHLIAASLKRITGIPWVADLRDLWSDNPYEGFKPKWRKFLDVKVEGRTLSKAECILTVSDTFARNFKGKINDGSKKLLVIANGYDDADFIDGAGSDTNKDISIERNNKFVISHIGNLYEMDRDPTPVFEAVGRLIANGDINGKKIELNFCGVQKDSPCRDALRELARRTGLEANLTIIEPINYKKALEMQKTSTVLLVLQLLDEKGKGFIPGKLFEHLGAKRPILALVPTGGEVQCLLEKTAGGEALDPRYDSKLIDNILLNWYEEWINNGDVAFQGKKDVIQSYSRKSSARQLAECLNELVAAKNSGR